MLTVLSIVPMELHPQIDDAKAKNVFVNQTFTLRCFVHIDLGVIIFMSWDVPDKKVSYLSLNIKM